jgi:hypothetical protein
MAFGDTVIVLVVTLLMWIGNAILCELQPVSVVDIYLPEDTSFDVLHNITLPTDLSDEQLGQGKRLLLPSFFRHKTTFDDQGEWERRIIPAASSCLK